jgi:tRNA (guanine37-N1)-methyltransferase
MERETLAVKVPEKLGEVVIRALRKLQLVDYKFEFVRSDQTLIIPIVRNPTEAEVRGIPVKPSEMTVQETQLPAKTRRARDLQDAVSDELPRDLMQKLPRSFDLVGDIAIVELSHELDDFASSIGSGIMRLNPHARLVLRKVSEISGKYRTSSFQRIAGAGTTETVYREFSNPMRLDVSSVYFNPRLSNERMRVASQVNNQERVLDMFAGVGPYTILIAKKQPGAVIYSIDINPQAFKYLKENLLLNRVADRVIPYLGDARSIVPEILKNAATRVVMNLPSEAIYFVDTALRSLQSDGGIIHYYSFASRGEKVANIVELVSKVVERNGRKVQSVRFAKVLKEIAPNRVQVAIDLVVE